MRLAILDVLPGNRNDSTTLKEIVGAVEDKYGKADRVWVMDRGVVSEENLRFLREHQGSHKRLAAELTKLAAADKSRLRDEALAHRHRRLGRILHRCWRARDAFKVTIACQPPPAATTDEVRQYVQELRQNGRTDVQC